MKMREMLLLFHPFFLVAAAKWKVFKILNLMLQIRSFFEFCKIGHRVFGKKVNVFATTKKKSHERQRSRSVVRSKQ
jgi:hypothetical protein